jgi:hypothetical protein
MPGRFPPPWSIEDDAACFIVRDHDKQALANVYFENPAGDRMCCRSGRFQNASTAHARPTSLKPPIDGPLRFPNLDI